MRILRIAIVIFVLVSISAGSVALAFSLTPARPNGPYSPQISDSNNGRGFGVAPCFDKQDPPPPPCPPCQEYRAPQCVCRKTPNCKVGEPL